MTAKRSLASGAPQDGSAAETGVPKERIAALFDGIVAITATLLILGVAIPGDADTLTLEALRDSGRALLHWAVSFAMVAMIWTEFHVVFAHARHWDGRMLLGTFVQMAAISVIPFAAQVMGDYPQSGVGALLFAAVMGVNGLLVSFNVWLLQRRAHLHVAAHTAHHLRRRKHGQMLVFPLVIALSLASATFHDPALGVAAWLLCPLALAALLRAGGGPAASVPQGAPS